MPPRIEKACERDIPLILEFIRKLAEYERMSHRVFATEDDLRAAFFGGRPVAEALLAFAGSEPAGFAVYFPTFSTFAGRAGIYLEDIFVEPAHRRGGIGTALLAAVAKLAVERGGALSWSVLKWNQPAIDFYKRLGAVEVTDWSGYKLSGEALARAAARSR
ncbi:MAG TPA: GNAT family N-acetyltransferase [Bryobacteraceae bacterium]|nr:GNAT family N-acetyltransferase [Bryobacteraceae bacterium]